ncbi:hypothetical protein [Desulfofundulus thermosubterraneus]|uniref:hypothetical protein n=1 Tax=Desulfofundulus thermosubterraneus TaxID=348840 RepID=UPI0010427C5D|nr:hypothetical protein [Desulfofundulus thermosubterraneus]
MNYWLPLKKPVPEFYYDLATWCEHLLAIIGPSFPPYLKKFEEEVRNRAAQKENVRPPFFSEGFRIYIFDHRLGTQLVLLDPTGKTAQWCHRFVHGNFRVDQYVYGDGELIGPQIPCEHWDHAFLKEFINSYGFAPIDELGHSWLVVFEGDSLDRWRPIAPWQVAFLLMKFRNKTLINWSEILKDSRYK